MRELTDHIVEGDSANHQLQIEVTDEPGAGGANHKYRIMLPPGQGNGLNLNACSVNFQNGPIKDAGVNGVTHEALLAIVIDRLNSFQNGPYSCADNQAALQHCAAALEFLQRRTKSHDS